MKICKRILSVSLSALIVMGCAMSALAAENTTEKEETVYVVLEPDGSVRSQTVSVHLHNESGLSGVTDRSALTGIENTHDATPTHRMGRRSAGIRTQVTSIIRARPPVAPLSAPRSPMSWTEWRPLRRS